MKKTISIVAGFCLIVGILVAARFDWYAWSMAGLAGHQQEKPGIAMPILSPQKVSSYKEIAKNNIANNTTNASLGELAFVTRVIDGDTILVQTLDQKTGAPKGEERIRYIGMDTPETVKPNTPVECYGHEASARDKQLVEGKFIWLVKDVSDRDKYGRLLRFVYVISDNTPTTSSTMVFVDLELIKEGYARVLTIPPDTGYKAEFFAAQDSAKTSHAGFWGACAQYPFQ
jgi:micrococcal nuclease